MPNTLADWLRREYPQARQNTLRQMLYAKRVKVNGIVARKMTQPVADTDRVEVADKVRTVAVPRNPIQPMDLIYEDADLLVVHKPAGLLTSTVPNEKRPTALAILSRYLYETDPEANLGLIHRLDRDASGLLVFSKDPQVFTSLKHQFYKHAVRREYVAITHGVPTPVSGRIESFLVELPDGSVRSTRKPGSGQRAVTDYRTLARGNGQAAVRVTLQTGRKHQIRAHLHERKVPIVGDRMYGNTGDAPRLMLAAVLLGFKHPVSGEAVVFEMAIPKQFPLVGGKKLTEIDTDQPSAPPSSRPSKSHIPALREKTL
jgi:23S rRNA pseudouridine1911/1915/1917 synthase